MEIQTGILIKRPVRSFQALRSFIRQCINAKVARCDSCDKAAIRVWFNDPAEWYLQCEDHADYREQFSGTTRFTPHICHVPAIKERVQVWYEELLTDEREGISLEDYDATDYYALLPDDLKPKERYWLIGGESGGWELELWELINGQFAYKLTWARAGGGRRWDYGLTAPFDTLEAARAAAIEDCCKRGGCDHDR